MIGMSPSTTLNVSTRDTPIHTIEPKPVPKVTMIEVPSDDAHLQCTRFPSPNGELCYHIDSPPDPLDAGPQTKRPPARYKELTEDVVLDKCRKLYPNIQQITNVLAQWVHKGREVEIDQQLVNALLFLDHELSISVLRQLRQPRAQLENHDPHRINKISSNSVIVPLTLKPTSSSNTYNVDALLDCGASGLGYLHKNWVATNNIPTKTLAYPIPVYNVDGMLNKVGSITQTADLVMTIGDHVEMLTFTIMNIGSSDVIIGFSWLKLHNPLVNWRTGKLCFTNCPSSCCLADTNTPTASDTPVSSVDDGPDEEHVRSLGEYPDTPADLYDLDTIKQDWLNFLMDELKDDDESLLCVDLNKLEEEK